jgi:DNA polymerase I
MNMLVIIARIGRMPIDDIARMGVSQWIRSLFYYEHRKRNCLIPKREELERRSEGVLSDAVIKDKKFRGGLVIDPKKGIHFDVVVMDFASLYPSIIKVRNKSLGMHKEKRTYINDYWLVKRLESELLQESSKKRDSN